MGAHLSWNAQTLVPETVRMVILLSEARLNVHFYQLRGMA
jgi:hypothetical protein